MVKRIKHIRRDSRKAYMTEMSESIKGVNRIQEGSIFNMKLSSRTHSYGLKLGEGNQN